MKISFVTSTLTSGGSERVMSLLANRFVADGYEVEIINLNQHIVFYSIDNRITLRFVEDEVGASVFKKLKWLRQYIKQSNPDIVIPFMEAVYCFTILALIGIKIPVLSSERIDPRKSPFIRNILRRIFLPLTDWLVVQTQDIKSFYPKFIQKKTSVIYNPVSDKVFQLPQQIKEDIVISVGKLDEQKNHALLIQAFSKIVGQCPTWKLVIYGEGPLRNELQLIIDNLQLTDRVFLPGRCTHIIEKMNKAKIFAFSSNYEGMSNALLEAVCVGLPIVTTNVSGAREIVQDGGFIVPVHDEKRFAAALEMLMRDEHKREEMGNNNTSRTHLYEIEKIYNKWKKIVFDLVSKEALK